MHHGRWETGDCGGPPGRYRGGGQRPAVFFPGCCLEWLGTAPSQESLGERYDNYRADWADRAALENTLQPEDVADAAWWLGAGALKTTGEVLLLDAGFRLGRA